MVLSTGSWEVEFSSTWFSIHQADVIAILQPSKPSAAKLEDEKPRLTDITWYEHHKIT